jgi:YHS domain-containing protein
MSVEPGIPLPVPGSQVKTACGGRVEFDQAIPRTLYRGDWLYFCLPSCRELFESNPEFSCLSEQEKKKFGD